jgi:hypothetical protein
VRRIVVPIAPRTSSTAQVCLRNAMHCYAWSDVNGYEMTHAMPSAREVGIFLQSSLFLSSASWGLNGTGYSINPRSEYHLSQRLRYLDHHSFSALFRSLSALFRSLSALFRSLSALLHSPCICTPPGHPQPQPCRPVLPVACYLGLEARHQPGCLTSRRQVPPRAVSAVSEHQFAVHIRRPARRGIAP